ncbi:hypothetical protein FPOAC2_09981 [Fusarium poae]
MDGKQYSEWTFSISLNAVTAILSTCCSAAMMHNVSAFIGQQKWIHLKKSPRTVYDIETFDEASRGPYGSILLLLRIPCNIGTLGALITILRLGFSPFSQAAVNLEPRMVDIFNNSSNFGYAHAYDRPVFQPGPNYDMPPDAMMQSAILQGLYDLKSMPIFNCDGACKWTDTYISLGFKSTCENVTISTLRTRKCIRSSYEPVICECRPEVCNYTTPGNVVLTTRSSTMDATTFRINATRTESDGIIGPDGIARSFGGIARIAVYKSGYGDTDFNATGINITECTIGFTAYEYKGARANGSTFSFGDVNEIDIQGVDWALKSNGPAHTTFMSNKSTILNLPSFNISNNDFQALQEFFETTTFQSEFVSGNYRNKRPGLSAALGGGIDVESAFDNMARSMTDYIRSGPNSKRAVGVGIESRIFVCIDWPWLIGPVILELVALIFAVCTIVATARKHEVPLWKSSALVLLSIQYDKNAGTIHGEFQGVKELEKMAKSSKARLE